MPVTIQRVEPHVYLSNYSDFTSIKEVMDMVENRKSIADDHADAYFVSIVDLTCLKSIPYDVSSIRRAVAYDSRNMRTLAIGAPLHVRAVIEAFRSLLGLKMEFFDTLEAALGRARELLERKREAI